MSEIIEEETLFIESPYKGNAPSFEEDDSFGFVIPGWDKKLRFHRSVLSNASSMFSDLFEGRSSSLCKYNSHVPQVDWIHKIGETDCDVLQTWLTFCYGKDATFTVKELPAALAVLLQLQLKCMEGVKTKIETKMKEVAKKNKEEIGCAMLVECATVYDECHDDKTSRIDVELAEIVLSLRL